MAKFTSGKWKYYRNAQGHFTVDTDPKSPGRWILGICYASPYCGLSCNDDEAEANARLIIVAPDMYAILRGLYEFKLEFSPDTRKRIGELLIGIDGEEVA